MFHQVSVVSSISFQEVDIVLGLDVYYIICLNYQISVLCCNKNNSFTQLLLQY